MRPIVEIDEVQSASPAIARWRQRIVDLHGKQANPDDYWRSWKSCFSDWNVDRLGSPPMWAPTEQSARPTQIARFLRKHELSSYAALHDWSTRDPDSFWHQATAELKVPFQHRPTRALSLADGITRPQWFPGARLNIAEACVEGTSTAPAIIVGTSDGRLSVQSREQLRRDVRQVAQCLMAAGFEPGDRIAIVMPMTTESVAIYLGLIYAGCVAVSIADSFAPAEIARRLSIANATGVFCVRSYRRANKVIAVYQRICEANGPRTIVVDGEQSPEALRAGDLSWREFLKPDEATAAHSARPGDYVNILFSSGTTGDPKAIPWTHSTPIKCIGDGFFHHDIQEADVVVWPTNLGWMMGPWLIFAALGNGATIGLFDDVTQATAFGRFIRDAQVTMLGVVPTLVRQWRAAGSMEGLDWTRLRCFSSTGEASRAEDMFYLSALAGMRPVIEYCGGTEIGGGYITSSFLHANVPGAFSCPAIGNRFVILDESNCPNDEGELYLVPPALGLSTSLLNRDHDETYFARCPVGSQQERLRRHGDFFRRQAGGTYVAGGRVDDTMNLGGIKVSSAEIEQVLNQLPEVSETAAVAVAMEGQGPDELVVFAVPVDTTWMDRDPSFQSAREAELCHRFNELLKRDLNPLFRVTHVRTTAQLPRTASNKVMRRELRTFFQLNGPMGQDRVP